MGPSLVPSHSVSVIDYLFILYSTYIEVVDVIYDTMHYAYVVFFISFLTDGSNLNDSYSSMHHTKLPAYLREQKKYHLAHHYKNYELGFGVTSKDFPFCNGTSSNVWFQAKFGTMCLTQCFHFKYRAVPYSFPLHVVFYPDFDYWTQRVLLIYVVIDLHIRSLEVLTQSGYGGPLQNK
jgi:hypothetical protein